MDFVANPVTQSHIFSSIPLEDVFAFYSNPSAYPELQDKIFSDYATDPKYFKICQTHSIYRDLFQTEFKIYYKLTEYNFKSRGFEYKLGLNIDTQPFNPSGCCSGGGLYFCSLENLYQFESYGNYLTPIVVPYDTPVYKETHEGCTHRNQTYEKLKAPCIYVLPRVRIDNPLANEFICQASPHNHKFANCMLHSSANIQDLKDFVSYSADKYFWFKQKMHSKLRIEIDAYLKLGARDSNAIKSILYLCVGFGSFDRQIIDFLINHAMPQLLDGNTYRIKPIHNLNLDASKYTKWFASEEHQIFSSCGIVAAGSSVLKCITNKNFKPNDIDLYINVKNLPKLKRSKDIQISVNDILLKTDYNMKNIIGVSTLETNSQIFNRFGDIKICKRRYQLIVVDTEPADFIKSNFDFDLCAIGYSFVTNTFVNVISKPDYSVLTIQPSYINKMCGSETDSYSEYRARKTFGRIQKYLSRGFVVSNWKEFLEAIEDSMCVN